MNTNCIIENWIMKNKTWLWFLFGILMIWALSVIGLMLFKYWYFDLSWSASRISLSNILSLGSAIGAIAVAVFAWMAYKDYWKQKKESSIYERIIKSTSLIHTEILQLRSYIRNYACNIGLHLDSPQIAPIPVDWLTDLIYDTDKCLSYIKNFHNTIANWQSELDYIYLFLKSIEKEITITDLNTQFKNLNKELTSNLFRNVLTLKEQLKNCAKQSNSNTVVLKSCNLKILIPEIIETEAKIKEFIESTIKAFS